MVDKKNNITINNRLNIQMLKELLKKPALYTTGEKKIWDDPHISKQMLKYHLNPDQHLASRKPETIERTVNWLFSHLGLIPGMEVADLGCGPGLYCTRFYQKGLRVTGIDFSLNSINYAQDYARKHGFNIKYIYQNYLELDYQEKFDIIILIYYDFGVLSLADQKHLLKKIYQALKPGGYFVFDVTTPSMRKGVGGENKNWELQEEGFWQPAPYLMLYEQFHYAEENVYLDQYLIVDQGGQIKIFRIWESNYTPASIRQLLNEAGFVTQEVWGDLQGSPFNKDSVSIGVVAHKTD
ncbi:MAG: class I SAM-dependent methyltransferase [Halanaerobiales bacterium]|nr:class I SAM-dependent methyltransferase [Halanaerobiales bacterium]